MTSRIVQHAHATGTAHRIGCIAVAAPLFFEARMLDYAMPVLDVLPYEVGLIRFSRQVG